MTRRDWWRFAVAVLIIVACVVIAHSPIGSWKFR
jgi:hypothetical protein